MGASKTAVFPVCRLTSEDLHKLAAIFDGISSQARSADNPIFRFETLAGTYTYDTFALQSRRYSQREVTAIEMLANNDKVSARLYIDLEEGMPVAADYRSPPPTVRSKLEAEGDEDAVFTTWDRVMSVVAFRRSGVARLMNSSLLVLTAFVLGGLILVLTGTTVSRLRLVEPFRSAGLLIGVLV